VTESVGSTRKFRLPSTWIRLTTPPWDSAEVARFKDQKSQGHVVFDITTSPAYWGSMLGSHEDLVMIQGGPDVAHAADQMSAANLVQAHLIEAMSAIGRPYLDFYFFQIRQELAPDKSVGAVHALKNAQEEGHIRNLGLAADSPKPALDFWQSNQIFDIALLKAPNAELEDFAKFLEVPVVTTYLSEFITMEGVPAETRL
jgi:hypothetical protein